MSNRLIGCRLELEGIELPEEMMNQTLEVLTTHESVRGFQKKPLPEGALKAILTAARSAPTSSNLQAYSIIIVTNEERKKERIGWRCFQEIKVLSKKHRCF